MVHIRNSLSQWQRVLQQNSGCIVEDNENKKKTNTPHPTTHRPMLEQNCVIKQSSPPSSHQTIRHHSQGQSNDSTSAKQ
jgi:hypothetical protein